MKSIIIKYDYDRYKKIHKNDSDNVGMEIIVSIIIRVQVN